MWEISDGEMHDETEGARMGRVGRVLAAGRTLDSNAPAGVGQGLCPQTRRGRKPKDARLVFEAIVYVLRTGCQWKALPAERFGSASAIHTRDLGWQKSGVFEALWKAG
jgi:transposase